MLGAAELIEGDWRRGVSESELQRRLDEDSGGELAAVLLEMAAEVDGWAGR